MRNRHEIWIISIYWELHSMTCERHSESTLGDGRSGSGSDE
jgi:hypothetical protein